MRAAASHFTKVVPVASLKRRVKVRRLMCATSANTSSESGCDRFSRAHSRTPGKRLSLGRTGKAAITKQDRALNARRATLVEQYALASMVGDEEGRVEAREAIDRFNDKNPSRVIKSMNLAQSVRMRRRRIEQAQDGVYLPRNRRDALEEGRFATTADDED